MAFGICRSPKHHLSIWQMFLCSLASTTSTCTVLHSPLPPPPWFQPPSLRRHMGMPTQQQLCRIPIATPTWITTRQLLKSEESCTDDDEEASVDILFGARKSWADMDPKSRALAVRKLLPHMKETLLTHLHPNIHSEAGDQEAAPKAETTVQRRLKRWRRKGP